MILALPYDDHAAMQVFRDLDAHDLAEAAAVRGVMASHLALFADWRAMQHGAVVSYVLAQDGGGGQPFAVLAIGNTGQAGVAQAALLARDHARFRRDLIGAGIRIRRDMPLFCEDLGIHRVEARCWLHHPTAAKFLTSVGFEFEAHMPGFGRSGDETFCQFAWINPTIRRNDHVYV